MFPSELPSGHRPMTGSKASWAANRASLAASTPSTKGFHPPVTELGQVGTFAAVARSAPGLGLDDADRPVGEIREGKSCLTKAGVAVASPAILLDKPIERQRREPPTVRSILPSYTILNASTKFPNGRGSQAASGPRRKITAERIAAAPSRPKSRSAIPEAK
jgi:hypothetical protein